jgi:hypothetical protein
MYCSANCEKYIFHCHGFSFAKRRSAWQPFAGSSREGQFSEHFHLSRDEGERLDLLSTLRSFVGKNCSFVLIFDDDASVLEVRGQVMLTG